MPVTPIKERDIQRAILDYLQAKRIFSWRNNAGNMFIEGKTGWRAIKVGMKGLPDILGVLPGGRFFAIEVKRPGNKATPVQQECIDQINKVGGLAFVATSVDNVIAAIEKIC